MTKEEKEYEANFGNIPHDYEERIAWMIDQYKISPKLMDEIIAKKRNIEFNLNYYDYFCVDYSIAKGKARPRYRINRANYMNAAINNPQFTQVYTYSPGAQASKKKMKRLLSNELVQLHMFIQTPCTINLNIFEKTPSSFNRIDKLLAEYGIIPSIGHIDADNYLKQTMDDLTGASLWLDDRLVVSATVNKFYSILPRQEIYIRYLNFIPNKAQYDIVTSSKEFKDEYEIHYLDKDGNINKEDK